MISTLLTVITSKLMLLVVLVFSTYLAFIGPPYETDQSAFSWFMTLFIFIVPSIQGLIDAYIFFESRIVSRKPRSNSFNNQDDRTDAHTIAPPIGSQARGLMNSGRKSAFEERVDFVFENFAVPCKSDRGSDDLEEVFGSGGDVDLESEDLNEIDLDSLDGNDSLEEGATGNPARRRASGILNASRGAVDVDDHGVEFRTLSHIHEIKKSGGGGSTTGKSPFKSASDPIDLITF